MKLRLLNFSNPIRRVHEEADQGRFRHQFEQLCKPLRSERNSQSDDASYITGQTIYACGGLTLFPEFRENWAS